MAFSQSLLTAALSKAPSPLQHLSPGVRAIALPKQAYTTWRRGRSGRRWMIAACRLGPVQFASDPGDFQRCPPAAIRIPRSRAPRQLTTPAPESDQATASSEASPYAPAITSPPKTARLNPPSGDGSRAKPGAGSAREAWARAVRPLRVCSMGISKTLTRALCGVDMIQRNVRYRHEQTSGRCAGRDAANSRR